MNFGTYIDFQFHTKSSQNLAFVLKIKLKYEINNLFLNLPATTKTHYFVTANEKWALHVPYSILLITPPVIDLPVQIAIRVGITDVTADSDIKYHILSVLSSYSPCSRFSVVWDDFAYLFGRTASGLRLNYGAISKSR